MTSARTENEACAEHHRQQQVYRKILNAFCFPGSPQQLRDDSDSCWPGPPRLGALLSVLATLADSSVTVCDQAGLVPEGISSALGFGFASAGQADMVISDTSHDYVPFEPRLGCLERPDLGATMIWLCEALGGGGHPLEITGPGVSSLVRLEVEGLNLAWLEARASWVGRFPLGVDVLICDSRQIVGLPRTSTVRIGC